MITETNWSISALLFQMPQVHAYMYVYLQIKGIELHRYMEAWKLEWQAYNIY